ncbi:MAG: hypothetical protein GC150_02210 [Rhizobiales bacterium]|nr:hypothetical protein [Hyphomicrobiales bacterium]
MTSTREPPPGAGSADDGLGFALAYAKGRASQRFYPFLAAGVLAAAWCTARPDPIALTIAVALLAVAYYNFPLVERRPRLGAGEPGIFIDGFGIIAWRAIADIKLVTQAVRSLEIVELQIHLNRDLAHALVADWRRVAMWRLLMKLPWSMSSDNVVHIKLEPFAPPPAEVHRRFAWLWKRYRS